jgi:hypothetical protein
MPRNITIRVRELVEGGRATSVLLRHWLHHEWRSVRGHRVELAERLQLARGARNLGELVYGQLDLLPESRRRWRRNAEVRRLIAAELGNRLQQMVVNRN